MSGEWRVAKEKAKRKLKESEKRAKRIKEREAKIRERREEERRRRREKRIIWRGVDGEDAEERRDLVEIIMEDALGRTVGVREIEERRGEDGRQVLIMELEDIKDKKEILRKSMEIRGEWGIGSVR
ncbi:stress response protein NST1-like [Monomorium pharaonis]|uniref:stress response protein NST1-like n=1 Tax=Monomorium pharaonis TaxID=307658 RepID=UPI001747D459|nr:stress response protein NST1-like [Monomorium pharaonis]